MTLNDLERGRERSNFFKRVYLIMLLPRDYRTTKFGRITRGDGLVLGDSHAPPPPHTHTMGSGPSALQFSGFSSIYAYILWRRTTKFDVVTYIVRGLSLGSQPRPRPKGRSPCAPPISGILLYLGVDREGAMFIGNKQNTDTHYRIVDKRILVCAFWIIYMSTLSCQ